MLDNAVLGFQVTYHIRGITMILQFAMGVPPVHWTSMANDMMRVIFGLLEVFPNPR